jgi:two-component system cell cycle sensor histidine kinase/response regulator CckA
MQIEYSEYQDQLVRGLAHRMNNILTLFHGYLGLLMDSKKLDAREREGLERITSGARAATELIDRTHALVRPASSAEREIDLGVLLRLLRTSFEARLGPKTELVMNVPDQLPIVCADAAWMKTAIVELVRNAMEATMAGGRVEVECRKISDPNGNNDAKSHPWILLQVVDNGSGVPERIADQVFQPFVTTKTQHESAGLGLTLALTFAHRHGGDIRFESRRGKTIFEMRLPCRR